MIRTGSGIPSELNMFSIEGKSSLSQTSVIVISLIQTQFRKKCTLFRFLPLEHKEQNAGKRGTSAPCSFPRTGSLWQRCTQMKLVASKVTKYLWPPCPISTKIRRKTALRRKEIELARNERRWVRTTAVGGANLQIVKLAQLQKLFELHFIQTDFSILFKFKLTRFDCTCL